MAVVKILRREGELLQVANRPQFGVGDGRLFRVLGEGDRGERRGGGEKRGAEENGRKGGKEIASHWKPFLDEVKRESVDGRRALIIIDNTASHNNEKSAATSTCFIL